MLYPSCAHINLYFINSILMWFLKIHSKLYIAFCSCMISFISYDDLQLNLLFLQTTQFHPSLWLKELHCACTLFSLAIHLLTETNADCRGCSCERCCDKHGRAGFSHENGSWCVGGHPGVVTEPLLFLILKKPLYQFL